MEKYYIKSLIANKSQLRNNQIYYFPLIQLIITLFREKFIYHFLQKKNVVPRRSDRRSQNSTTTTPTKHKYFERGPMCWTTTTKLILFTLCWMIYFGLNCFLYLLF